ncbi:MAG: universal stress protein [Gammaproteobacteria bacterium]|nr:universal stress protein [Gammaproteobacteria bacterium]
MTVKTLLVHVDNAKACEGRIAAAAALANRFDAELSGIYVTESFPYGYADGMMLSPTVVQRVEEEIAASAKAAEDAFCDAAASVTSGTRWTALTGPRMERLSVAARCVDLAIVGQHNADDARSPSVGLAGDIALTAGRPVLMIPSIGAGSPIGERPMVAWNGSREAARAVTDAMPFLLAASRVDLFAVGDVAAQGASASDAAAHLARHGIDVEMHALPGDKYEPEDYLLSYAVDLGTDLLVMGAYGHSRTREFVFGGVTRTVLSEVLIPTLLSH